jgi:alcohol dehydrogenase class IV
VAKFAQVWDLIPDADRTLSEEEKSHALVAWLAALVKRLPLPDNLAALGVPQESIPALSAAAQNVKRLMNNAPAASAAKRSRLSTKRCFQNMPNRRK